MSNKFSFGNMDESEHYPSVKYKNEDLKNYNSLKNCNNKCLYDPIMIEPIERRSMWIRYFCNIFKKK